MIMCLINTSCSAQIAYKYSNTIETPIQNELRRLDNPCAIRFIFEKGFNISHISMMIGIDERPIFEDTCSTDILSGFACDYCLPWNGISEFPKHINLIIDDDLFMINTDNRYKRIVVDKQGHSITCTYSNNVSLYE